MNVYPILMELFESIKQYYGEEEAILLLEQIGECVEQILMEVIENE